MPTKLLLTYIYQRTSYRGSFCDEPAPLYFVPSCGSDYNIGRLLLCIYLYINYCIRLNNIIDRDMDRILYSLIIKIPTFNNTNSSADRNTY